jgi:23S rRNA (uracil1939-C5)-methyltransferase
MPPPFEFSPQKLVYGGEALGYHDGRVVLVPRVLPGERVEAEEVRTAKGVVHARPLRILAAAPERVEPPCPYFGRCGGCHYQHLGAALQAAAKREILRETLRRIGKITWDEEIPTYAAEPWNYRNQAQLKIAAQADGTVALGFFEAESHRLFPVDTCLILSPRLNEILGELRKQERLARLAAAREVELLADDRDEQVMLTLRGRFEPGEIDTLAHDFLARLPGVASVAIERGSKLRGFGKPSLDYRVGDLHYQVSPGSFFQASRLLIPQLVASVAPGFSPARASGTSPAPLPGGATLSKHDDDGPVGERHGLALDLYAGVGLLSLPLAQSFAEVVAVEGNPVSAADLARNARAQGLANLRVVGQSVFDFLRRFPRSGPDLVVLDPPRAGVGLPTLKLLTGLKPRRITYVSCHPPTLARDLGYLVERGYRLSSVELFDFFPQTFHIESLAKLVRSDPVGREGH